MYLFYVDESASRGNNIGHVYLKCEKKMTTKISKVSIVPVPEAYELNSVFDAQYDGDHAFEAQLFAYVGRKRGE